MDELIYWVALKNVPNLGCLKGKRLLEVFKTPYEIFNSSPSDLSSVKGIGESIVKGIKQRDKLLLEAEEEVNNVLTKGYSLINLNDPYYPFLLREIIDPPLILYVKGKLERENKNSIAVVGTRFPDYYGKTVTFNICSKLAFSGFTIVSGMARGIDTIAHKAAIKSDGITIAVLGCGIDVVYPPENEELFDEIALHGAIISEFPMGTKPVGTNFPRRNRIISGICRGVLVIQAREKSGTFHTVNSALEQGREVYAVPGPIDKELSKGTHRLIKEGAKLVEDINDIFEELGPVSNKEMELIYNKNIELTDMEKMELIYNKNIELTDMEKQVLSIISTDGMGIDDIIRKSNMDTGKVSSVLGMLELKGLIEKLKGNFYIRLNFGRDYE